MKTISELEAENAALRKQKERLKQSLITALDQIVKLNKEKKSHQ